MSMTVLGQHDENTLAQAQEVEKSIEVLHTLAPLIVVMAGEDELGPYKD